MPTDQEKAMHGTGAIPSPADYRYVNVEHLAGAMGGADIIPTDFHIDYSGIPDIYQRHLGACTAHAAAEIRMHRELRTTGKIKLFCPRFTHTMAKIEDGLTDLTNQGTYPVMPLKIGVKYGFATEDIMQNDTLLDFNAYIYNRDIQTMPAGVFQNAAQYRIPGYAQVGKQGNITAVQLMQGIVSSMDGVKTCLPLGAEWYTAATDGHITWNKSYILPIRKCVTAISGHDITVTGMHQDEVSGRWQVYFRNHWSKDWADGDNGWFYFDDHILTEAWIVTEIPDPLLAIIKSLPAQKDFTHTWSTDLKPTDMNEDVRALQIALKIVGTFTFTQQVTPYFGSFTKGAVMAFQREYKITSESEIAGSQGKVGPKTRRALNQMFSA